MQTVVANVGGIAKVIFTVATVVNWICTRNFILFEIIISCFFFVFNEQNDLNENREIHQVLHKPFVKSDKQMTAIK